MMMQAYASKAIVDAGLQWRRANGWERNIRFSFVRLGGVVRTSCLRNKKKLEEEEEEEGAVRNVVELTSVSFLILHLLGIYVDKA